MKLNQRGDVATLVVITTVAVGALVLKEIASLLGLL